MVFDRFAADQQRIPVDFNLFFIFAIIAVVFEQVCGIFDVHQVVNAYQFQVFGFEDYFQSGTSDAAKSIDCYSFHDAMFGLEILLIS
ncbi:hypothetical protein D3C87_1975670 [compost metagenome]